jgi:DNA-binding NarL/FixJ family response regulator
MVEALARVVSDECDVVGTVADGEALLREARRLTPDVVILDIFMPVMNGFAAGRQLKIDLPLIGVIFVTAQPDEASREVAIRIAASALIAKASVGTGLLHAIRKAMADKSQGDEPSGSPATGVR